MHYTTVIGTGDVSYIAYVKPGENRPITFTFNGGPGSSSIWLHLGAFGPRRIVSPEEGGSTLPPYSLVDNTESLLDLTDLVFIDPKGTGLSPPAAEEEHVYSLQGDVHSIGDFIRDYLTTHKRWNCPKYLAGESYGGMRAAGLAAYLQNEYNIFLTGILFISPALDFQSFIFEPDNPMPYFLYLPTYATTAWYHGKFRPNASVEEVAAEARTFAFNTYAPALLRRQNTNIWEQLAEITGLPLWAVKRQQGYITDFFFLSELLSDERKHLSIFDTRFAHYGRVDDADVAAIFSGAFHDYLARELESPQSYCLFSAEINRKWNFWDTDRWGHPCVMESLRNALRANPAMKIFVGCGYFDLAVPFAAVEYAFDHLAVPDVSVQMEYYEGGHMYYLNPTARVKCKQDLVRFYQRTPP
jgi:carboxypeptidase C (cathepsin A)